VTLRRPRILARAERVDLGGRVVTGARVDVGNPHFVVRVEDVSSAPVLADGPRLEQHPAFERGTNVEFVALRDGRASMRVWERGVGETEACGSGACAAAAALVDAGLATLPLSIELVGGTLSIGTAADGAYTLAGTVDDLGHVPVPVAASAALRAHGAPDARDASVAPAGQRAQPARAEDATTDGRRERA
jgi:diaminopimelate epimerase